jgi:hypothetical protein
VTVNVAVVRLPLKVTKLLEEVFVITTLVPVVTLPVNVVPPEFVIVKDDKDVLAPRLPLMVIVPEEPLFSVSPWVLALVPFTVLLNEILFPVEDAPVDAAVMELPRVTAPV